MTDITPVLAKYPRFLALAKLTDRFFNLPTWKAIVWHVDSVEAELLPYLAEAMGVTDTAAWQKASSERERRAIIRGSYERHRTRGTAAGLIREAAEAGGRVLEIISPPSKFFLSSSYSVAERNAWLANMPEIRLYPRRERGKEQGMHLGSCFLGAGFLVRSDAILRSRLRATLVKDGVETELETPDWEIASEQKQVTTTIMIPGKAGHASFLGQPNQFLARTDASLRRIVLKNVSLYDERTAKLGLRTIQPGLKPIDADGEMISEAHTATSGATFLGKGSFPQFLISSRAYLYHYRRIKLHDPEAPVSRARAASHLGVSRLGMPPHHAHVKVELLGNTPVPQFLGKGNFTVSGDREPLNKLLDNMLLAKRASDKITVSTKTHRPLTSGLHIVAEPEVIAGGLTQK